MGYRYETHMHTAEGSRCGRMPAAEMVRAYKKLGYTGVFVTDHFLTETVPCQENFLGMKK